MNDLRYYWENQNKHIENNDNYIEFIKSENTLIKNDIILLSAFYNDSLGIEDKALTFYEKVDPSLLNDSEIKFDFYLCCGSTYNWNFKFEKALDKLSKAEEISPNNQRVKLFKMISKYGLGDLDEMKVLDFASKIGDRSIEFSKSIILEIKRNKKQMLCSSKT